MSAQICKQTLNTKHFLGEYLECKDKSHTFASAFEKQALKRMKKEFFEKIYINREVVQEASMETYLGKRNEPFN